MARRDLAGEARPDWRRASADALITGLARLLVRVFFRDVAVVGRDLVPSADPVVLVANHPSGLVDALLLMATGRRFPRFLGKSTLWRILPLRPFLALAGVVPVQRAADTAHDLSPQQRRTANDAAFARCRLVLAGGGVVAVFPEGVSHDEPSLRDLRGGAARIALGAATDDHVPGVQVVAAGIVYDDKARFRSRALVRYAPPRPVDSYAEEALVDPQAAVTRLTEDMAEDLRRAAPDFANREVADTTLKIADVVARRPGERLNLARRDTLARSLAAVVDTEDGRSELARLGRRVAEYQATLAALGIDDAGLIDHRPARHATLLGAGALKLVVALPVAVAGVAIQLVPYAVIKLLARLPRDQSMKATVKLLGSFGLYSVWYLALAAVVGRRHGWGRGAVALVAAPVSGWVALVSSERLDRVEGVRRVATTWRHHRAAAAQLLVQRDAIDDAAQRVLAHAGNAQDSHRRR